MIRHRSYYSSCKAVGTCLVGNEDWHILKLREMCSTGLVCADHTYKKAKCAVGITLHLGGREADC